MRIYYQPNGGLGAVPEITELGTIKVFGCTAWQDYADGKVLFARIPNAPMVFAREIEAFRPDVVVVETFTPSMVLALSKVRQFYVGAIVGMWGDTVNRNSFEILRRCGRYLDALYILDKRSEAGLQALGVPSHFTVLPAMSLYKHDPSTSKIYDVVFAGNICTESRGFVESDLDQRLELIRAFAARPGFALFGGEGWKKYSLPVKGWVNEYELAKVYNQAKIVLASDKFLHLPGFTSNRTHKALLCGVLVLIRRFAGIEELFTNGRELVWFDSVEEALSLVDYYLAHEDERYRIATAGMEWASRHARVRELFKRWIDVAPRGSYPAGARDEASAHLWRLYFLARKVAIRLGLETGILPRGWLHWRNSP